MQIGDVWAYRERISDPNCPLIPAEIIQFGRPRSHKVRVRWQGGQYPGLDAWVPKVRLPVLWSEAEAWLRDERLYHTAHEASSDAVNTTEHKAALMAVLVHPMPDGILIGYGGSGGATVEVSDLSAVAKDLELNADTLLHEPLAFIDRHGTYVAPWPVARSIAVSVAERYADLVLSHVAKEEAEVRDQAVHGHYFDLSRKEQVFIPPEKCAEWLREKEPVFAQVREWCGAPAIKAFDELKALRQENARLRTVIGDEVRRLEGQGEQHEARRLQKRLEREER
jgi:hypothetical protein